MQVRIAADDVRHPYGNERNHKGTEQRRSERICQVSTVSNLDATVDQLEAVCQSRKPGEIGVKGAGAHCPIQSRGMTVLARYYIVELL